MLGVCRTASGGAHQVFAISGFQVMSVFMAIKKRVRVRSSDSISMVDVKFCGYVLRFSCSSV